MGIKAPTGGIRAWCIDGGERRLYNTHIEGVRDGKGGNEMLLHSYARIYNMEKEGLC